MPPPLGERCRSDAVASLQCTGASVSCTLCRLQKTRWCQLLWAALAHKPCDAAFWVHVSLCSCRRKLLLRPCRTACAAGYHQHASWPCSAGADQTAATWNSAVHICAHVACQSPTCASSSSPKSMPSQSRASASALNSGSSAQHKNFSVAHRQGALTKQWLSHWRMG